MAKKQSTEDKVYGPSLLEKALPVLKRHEMLRRAGEVPADIKKFLAEKRKRDMCCKKRSGVRAW